MPAVSLVCPHCEKPVEVQVTGVTRSRPCPVCGEMLMLQVAEKNKKAKRRALLMGGALPEASTGSTLQIPSRQPQVSNGTQVQIQVKPATAAPPIAKETETPQPPEAATDPSKAAESLPPHEVHQPPAVSQVRTLNFEPSHEPQVLPGDAFERMRMDPEIKEFRKRLIVGTCVVIGCILLVVLIRLMTPAGVVSQPKKVAVNAAEVPAMIEAEPESPPVPDGSLVFKAPGKQDFAKATAKPVAPAVPAAGQITMSAALSIEVLRKFLAAPNWKERLFWCRPLDGIDKRMAAFYAQNADGPVAHEDIVESRELSGGFLEHTVVMEGGGRRLALVENTPKGPRVDWAAFVGAGDLGWSEFMEQRPVLPVTMRVMVSDGFYYENQFGSPRLLKCLELRCVSEPGAPLILGYIERDNSMAQQIEFWLKKSEGTALPMTLRLKYPSNAASPKQVWISQIVRLGWQDQ
jgi:hypothetical protein